ncbi:MAG: tetratricopeptide repeat protein, partial [Acidobacteriota bacterium]
KGSVLLGISGCVPLLCAQAAPQQRIETAYRAAGADYSAGRYAAAAQQLESILPYSAKNFEVHELLGLSYASMSEPEKALSELQTAVQLKPNSGAAHTNLGTVLLYSGKTELAGEQFRKALQLEPANYDINHNLGELYAKSGQLAKAQPLLATAYRAKPDAYDNGYDLAMADFLLGHMDDARQVIQSLAKAKNTGELHNLLAQIDEKQGKFVDAANEYATAAHLDPTEDNLFAWGSEMLLHRTYEPAITIFQDATARFPNSPRLFIGLGLALYSRARYDEALKALLRAADLDPSDPRVYLFLSKASDSSPAQADAVAACLRRYAEQQPDNARAQYYYAMNLWKAKRPAGSAVDLPAVESLLKKSVALDDSFTDAHVQLGDFYADQHKYEQSIPEYERALALDPGLADAHYRLGMDYVHLGRKDLAEKEIAVYQKLRADHLAQVDKERAEVRQFVYSAQPPAPSVP